MKSNPKSAKSRRKPETFGLPDTVDLAAVDEAEIEVIRLASERRIGAFEAFYFSRMLEHRRRAIGDRTLEELMRKIDGRQQQQKKGGKP